MIYWPSQEPDPHPRCGDSSAHSSPPAPWSSPRFVWQCPEAVQNRVKFRCFSPPGIAWARQSHGALQQHPRKCLLPTPAPCTQRNASNAQTNGVSATEMSSEAHVQPKFSCGHPNLTAQLKQKEAEQELVPKIAAIKGSCQTTGNVKQCPALLPGFVECCFNRDAESSDSSKFLELLSPPANFPVTLSTFGCKQAQIFTSGSPRAVQTSGLGQLQPTLQASEEQRQLGNMETSSLHPQNPRRAANPSLGETPRVGKAVLAGV